MEIYSFIETVNNTGMFYDLMKRYHAEKLFKELNRNILLYKKKKNFYNSLKMWFNSHIPTFNYVLGIDRETDEETSTSMLYQYPAPNERFDANRYDSMAAITSKGIVGLRRYNDMKIYVYLTEPISEPLIITDEQFTQIEEKIGKQIMDNEDSQV